MIRTPPPRRHFEPEVREHAGGASPYYREQWEARSAPSPRDLTFGESFVRALGWGVVASALLALAYFGIA